MNSVEMYVRDRQSQLLHALEERDNKQFFVKRLGLPKLPRGSVCVGIVENTTLGSVVILFEGFPQKEEEITIGGYL